MYHFPFGPFSALDGENAPQDWQGAFNCTYKYGGPGFKPTSAFNGRYSSARQKSHINCTEILLLHISEAVRLFQ